MVVIKNVLLLSSDRYSVWYYSTMKRTILTARHELQDRWWHIYIYLHIMYQCIYIYIVSPEVSLTVSKR